MNSTAPTDEPARPVITSRADEVAGWLIADVRYPDEPRYELLDRLVNVHSLRHGSRTEQVVICFQYIAPAAACEN
jgi:hypothetical protein